MNNELRKFIKNWQFKNDFNFSVLPTDEHSSLIFNNKNEITTFIFSNNKLRDKCKAEIPLDLLENYTYMIEQENGFTYYDFN